MTDCMASFSVMFALLTDADAVKKTVTCRTMLGVLLRHDPPSPPNS